MSKIGVSRRTVLRGLWRGRDRVGITEGERAGS